MKFISMMNGWKDAPEYWLRYLILPFGWDFNPAWKRVSFFGFVFFFE